MIRGWMIPGVGIAALLLAGCSESSGQVRQERVSLSDRVELVAEIADFEQDQHSLTFCEPQLLCLVDGYPVFGTEGAVPTAQLTSLYLLVDGNRVDLDHLGMYNPWSPVEGEAIHVELVESAADELRVQGEFSDGAAAYVAEWLVVKGGSVRVSIDCLECVAMMCSRLFGPEER